MVVCPYVCEGVPREPWRPECRLPGRAESWPAERCPVLLSPLVLALCAPATVHTAWEAAQGLSGLCTSYMGAPALVYLEEELLHSMRVPSPKLGLLPLRPYLPRPTHLLRSLLQSLLDYALPALALLSVVPVYSDLWGNPHTPHLAYLPAAPWS